MLRSFNENVGLWIQFGPGRDVLSAQKAVVDQFKVFLRSYGNVLSVEVADNTYHYEQVNESFKENNWVLFQSIIRGFLIEPLVYEADSSLIPSRLGP